MRKTIKQKLNAQSYTHNEKHARSSQCKGDGNRGYHIITSFHVSMFGNALKVLLMLLEPLPRYKRWFCHPAFQGGQKKRCNISYIKIPSFCICSSYFHRPWKLWIYIIDKALSQNYAPRYTAKSIPPPPVFNLPTTPKLMRPWSKLFNKRIWSEAHRPQQAQNISSNVNDHGPKWKKVACWLSM